MDSRKAVKPKRQKKKKSRTEVFSDDSESDSPKPVSKSLQPEDLSPPASTTPKPMSNAEIQAAFTSLYMQRATSEFAEDLDKVREADDFKDEALPLLIQALQQGTGLFGIEEMKRVVMAGKEKGVGIEER